MIFTLRIVYKNKICIKQRMSRPQFISLIHSLSETYPNFSSFVYKTFFESENIKSVKFLTENILSFVKQFEDLFNELYLLKMLWELYVGDIYFINHFGGPSVVHTKVLAAKSRKRPLMEDSEKPDIPRMFWPCRLNMYMCEPFHVYKNAGKLRELRCVYISMHTLNIYFKHALNLHTLVIEKPSGKPINDKDLNFPKSLRHLVLINCDKIIKIDFKKLPNLYTLCIVGLPLSRENVKEIMELDELNTLYLEKCEVDPNYFNGCKINIVIC